jgi:predicted DsbA family dithiol-disulfide isomerase
VHELAASDPDIEIVWRAFELRPHPVPTLDPQGEYLRSAWTNFVYPLADRLGMKIKLPPIQPRSRLAHEAAHWARSKGRFDEYHANIFRSFFERGEDIGDISVLTSIASELQMDSDSLCQGLVMHEFLPSVIEDERQAGLSGVSGVPAFIADRQIALTGAQPVHNLRQLIKRARSLAQ